MSENDSVSAFKQRAAARRRGFEVGNFIANPNGVRKRQRRGTTDPKKRRKIANVREEGACMACRMLKVECDPVDPSDPSKPCHKCFDVMNRKKSSGVLAFRWCIRVRISGHGGVNIFRQDVNPEFTCLDSLLAQRLNQNPVTLDFDIDWSFQALLDIATTWIKQPKESPTKGLVGSLCSKEFLDLVGGNLDPSFMQRFRLMLYSLSLSWITPPAGGVDYRQLGHGLGHRVLNDLEHMLTPHFLSNKVSLATFQSLFLVLLGCIFSVSYAATPPQPSPPPPDLLRFSDGWEGFGGDSSAAQTKNWAENAQEQPSPPLPDLLGFTGGWLGVGGGSSVSQTKDWFGSGQEQLSSPFPDLQGFSDGWEGVGGDSSAAQTKDRWFGDIQEQPSPPLPDLLGFTGEWEAVGGDSSGAQVKDWVGNVQEQLSPSPLDPLVFRARRQGVGGDSSPAQTKDWLWDAQQEHLASMLAHFVLLIGARLGLRFGPKTEEKFIVPVMVSVQTGGRFTWSAAGAKEQGEAEKAAGWSSHLRIPSVATKEEKNTIRCFSPGPPIHSPPRLPIPNEKDRVDDDSFLSKRLESKTIPKKGRIESWRKREGEKTQTDIDDSQDKEEDLQCPDCGAHDCKFEERVGLGIWRRRRYLLR